MEKLFQKWKIGSSENVCVREKLTAESLHRDKFIRKFNLVSEKVHHRKYFVSESLHPKKVLRRVKFAAVKISWSRNHFILKLFLPAGSTNRANPANPVPSDS